MANDGESGLVLTPAAYEEMRDRLAKAEWRADATEKRLNDGAQTFSSLAAGIKAVEDRLAPKPMTRLQILGFILGPLIVAIVVVGGFIWQAAQYPNREEFNKAKERLDDVQRGLTSEITNFKLEQVQMKGDVAALKSNYERMERAQTSMVEKLDVLINRGRR